MPNSNRRAGDYFERQARDALAAEGWVIIRAAGSLGPADIVALRLGSTPLLISCKVTPRIGPAERLELISVSYLAGARPVLAFRPKAGHIELRTVMREPGGKVLATLKVPPR